MDWEGALTEEDMLEPEVDPLQRTSPDTEGAAGGADSDPGEMANSDPEEESSHGIVGGSPLVVEVEPTTGLRSCLRRSRRPPRYLQDYECGPRVHFPKMEVFGIHTYPADIGGGKSLRVGE